MYAEQWTRVPVFYKCATIAWAYVYMWCIENDWSMTWIDRWNDNFGMRTKNSRLQNLWIFPLSWIESAQAMNRNRPKCSILHVNNMCETFQYAQTRGKEFIKWIYVALGNDYYQKWTTFPAGHFCGVVRVFFLENILKIVPKHLRAFACFWLANHTYSTEERKNCEWSD